MSEDDRDHEDRIIVAWVLGIAVTMAIAVALLTGIGTALFSTGRAGVATSPADARAKQTAAGHAAAGSAGTMAAGSGAAGSGATGTAAAAHGAAAPVNAASATSGGAAGTAANPATAATSPTADVASQATGLLAAAASATISPRAKAPPAPAAAPVERAQATAASSHAGDVRAVKIYFASGHAQPLTDSVRRLAPIVAYAKSHRRSKVVVAGFHDKTGGAGVNADLSRRRAATVAAMLKKAGVPASQIDLRKPQLTVGGEDNREARRAEVSIE